MVHGIIVFICKRYFLFTEKCSPAPLQTAQFERNNSFNKNIPGFENGPTRRRYNNLALTCNHQIEALP